MALNVSRQVDDPTASPIDGPSVSKRGIHGAVALVNVAKVCAIAIPSTQVSVPRISLQRPKMAPVEPEGSARRKNDNAEAV